MSTTPAPDHPGGHELVVVANRLPVDSRTLPDGANAPVVQKFDPNAQPILTLALLGGAARPSEVTTFAEDTLVPRLQRVDGVADVSVTGGPERQVQVLLDPARLQGFDLAPARISGAIGASALDLPAGTLDQNGSTTSYSTRNTPRSAADVGRIVVDPATGLRVSDVATVRDASAAASSYARVNGQPAVLPEGDRRRRRHHRVHRRGDDRHLEVVGVDLPVEGDLLGVARAPGRGHRDVVEGVGPTAALASPDLDLVHPVRVREEDRRAPGDQSREAVR